MRTQTFLRSTQKTSSTTPSSRCRSKTPARRQSQSAKMLCPLRTTERKRWAIKSIRNPGTQENTVSHRLARIFADLFAVRAPLQQQQSAKAGWPRGSDDIDRKAKSRVSGSERVKRQHSNPRFFLLS